MISVLAARYDDDDDDDVAEEVRITRYETLPQVEGKFSKTRKGDGRKGTNTDLELQNTGGEV